MTFGSRQEHSRGCMPVAICHGTLVKYHNTMALTRISQIGDVCDICAICVALSHVQL